MVKRLFDIVVSATLLLLLAPIMLGVAIAVRLKLGGPVLFSQERPGLNGQPFRLLKFRSMMPPGKDSGDVIADELKRLTPFSEWLRNSSLDELPSLFNVLGGSMSLVGPRPLLMKYLPLYNAEQRRRHEVHPGITGWAQVNGRSAISWEDKFALDVWYVDNRSLWLDIKILILTAINVASRRDVTPQDIKLMPNFVGSLAALEDENRDPSEPVADRSLERATNV
ncbi:MAG: sugar transferase [Verrucomicrobiaceae bacterium]|nr:MAG: sugar transferase [Verrucomicrobiaceae bacterium]